MSERLRSAQLPGSSSVDGPSKFIGDDIAFHDDASPFELPARLFEQLPFAIYLCDRDGYLVRYNRRAAELWGRSPIIGDRNERFCGSYRMFRADGSPMPHDECYMVDVLRTGISVRQQEIQVERPDGIRGIAVVDIEAIRDSTGTIVGAVNCFQDVTERRQLEERQKILIGELQHRTRNLIGVVGSIAKQTMAHTGPTEAFRDEFSHRLEALARVQ